MPKIEVQAQEFFSRMGRNYSDEQLEELLVAAKAELDGKDEDEGIIKIELNDTNRPDLWSTSGLARQLRSYEGAQPALYDFFSNETETFETDNREVHVDPRLKDIRPYVVAFCVSGKKVDESTLLDLIQTQEKLCWNYGRKRSAIAMGVYRSDLITFPVQYKAADPDKVSFIPLQDDRKLSLRDILKKTPKGMEFGHIIADFDLFPFLTDSSDKVLSLPPVINSNEIGAVQIGDEHLFIELTGTELHALIHTASIVACDLADEGFTIEPVKICYPYDTEFGRELVVPYYFQEPVGVELSYASRMLGVHLHADEALASLKRMGVFAVHDDGMIYVTVPEYRNDFLHPVDIIEDIMIGRGMGTFSPIMPNTFTPGRLTVEEEFTRKAKDLMIGLGYQEMMYNYLGSARDYIEKMNLTHEGFIQIANPMSENYEYVRASIAPALLQSEAVSSNAVYPHRIFEIGKVAFLDEQTNSGTATRNFLGFLFADSHAGFNQLNSHVSSLMYYLDRDYRLEEQKDPRFIEGRCASIWVKDVMVGVFGEVNPQVLDNWGIQMPSGMGEIDLDLLLHGRRL